MKNQSSQPSGFRDKEVTRLFHWMQAGESASIIGMSGVGKSNLFNHLRDPKTRVAYLGEMDAETILVRANFHYVPDFTDRSIYSLILEQLELLDAEAERLGLPYESLTEIGRYHELMLDAVDDVLKVQRYFKLAIRQLLGNSSRRLVLLCDQFDEVYQEADPRLFANLRGLREAYKYRLSYLLFTRDSLLFLTDMDPEREEFYELMASNVMGLKPYSLSDAETLLNRVSSRNQLPLPEALSERLYELTGGHAGLLRAAYLGVTTNGLGEGVYEENAAEKLLALPAVAVECDKIWRSLSLRERRLLAYRAHGMALQDSERVVEEQLNLKGVLSETADSSIFAPILARFVADQEALWERPLYFDQASRQVWVLGRPAPTLTQLEYRLFHLLYQRDGEVVAKDELVQAGWPSALGGVSDEAIIAAIARLRKKIEPDPKNPRFLENIHNQGYVLKIE